MVLWVSSVHRPTCLGPAESFTRWDVLWNHQTNVHPDDNLCYLIKLLSVFPACVIFSSFVSLSIFIVLSNFCHLLTLCYLVTFYVTYAPVTRRTLNGISAIVRFRTIFLGIYISLVISQDIPSCETFSRELSRPFHKGVLFYNNNNNDKKYESSFSWGTPDKVCIRYVQPIAIDSMPVMLCKQKDNSYNLANS